MQTLTACVLYNKYENKVSLYFAPSLSLVVLLDMGLLCIGDVTLFRLRNSVLFGAGLQQLQWFEYKNTTVW